MPFRPAASLIARLLIVIAATAGAASAASDRGKVEAFLKVTGYDVVIESLQQGAMAGPGMVGDAPETFGRQYSDLAEQVFDPAQMQSRALDILSAVMPDALVDAGADFYASPLGQRLVAVENAAHLADREVKLEEGQKLVQAMMADNPDRLETFKALNDAIGSEETGRKAIVEIQLHFVMAAMAAGALPSGPSEDDLRATLMRQAEEQSGRSAAFALISNAYTYRDIDDDDLAAYLHALQSDAMRQVYEILNGVQYQVMIERYEALGARLGDLKPQQDL